MYKLQVVSQVTGPKARNIAKVLRNNLANYLASDSFILYSAEIFGLVLNEQYTQLTCYTMMATKHLKIIFEFYTCWYKFHKLILPSLEPHAIILFSSELEEEL